MIQFSRPPPTSAQPILFPSYSPNSTKGRALSKEVTILLDKGAIEPATPSPGFYSRLFIVAKASGSWRPVIDLSTLNTLIIKTKFKMETVRSVLAAIRYGDWMCSIDLKDAYFQIPIHPESIRFLRFVTEIGVFQFRVLCFGLSTAPQVFTRVMAPVSAILHQQGIRMLRYLDDWVILASSQEDCLKARDTLLSLCKDLNIIFNPDKSHLIPSQRIQYLGMDLDSSLLKAATTLQRRETLLNLIMTFLAANPQPVIIGQRLLGHL